MPRRAALIAVVGLTLQACTKEPAATPSPGAAARESGTGSATPPATTPPATTPPGPPAVALAAMDPAVALPVTSRVYLVVKADGSLAIGAAPVAFAPDGLDLSTVTGSPVALAELDARARALAAVEPPKGTEATADPCDDGRSTDPGWYGTIADAKPAPYPAGLRGQERLGEQLCAPRVPLVLVDAAAPAARLVEVLDALTLSLVGITTDGGAHAQTLGILFRTLDGAAPTTRLELGFTLSPDGIDGAAYRGPEAAPKVWAWSGDAGALADGFAQANAVEALAEARGVRLRVAGDLTAGDLISAIAILLKAGVIELGIGEPVDAVPEVAPVPKDQPLAHLGQPTLTGAYDPALLRRYLKRNLSKIKHCYEQALLADPTLAGEVLARFVITPDGNVGSSEASGVSDEVSSCVAKVILAIELPRPKDGGATVVSHSFTFAPTGG